MPEKRQVISAWQRQSGNVGAVFLPGGLPVWALGLVRILVRVRVRAYPAFAVRLSVLFAFTATPFVLGKGGKPLAPRFGPFGVPSLTSRSSASVRSLFRHVYKHKIFKRRMREH